jgi:uncharacterized protein YbaR (Trm112 family)
VVETAAERRWARRVGLDDRGGGIMIDKELLEILACPKCKAEVRLDEGAQRIICTSPTCGLRYPIRDGIPVMLIDEAEAPGCA